MELDNLTRLAELGFSLYIEEHRYGAGRFLAGIDFPFRMFGVVDDYDYFGRESVYEYIAIANDSGDDKAMDAYFKLCDFAEENKQFLFATGESINECLSKLDKRAGLWLAMDKEEQGELLDKFIKFQKSSPIV